MNQNIFNKTLSTQELIELNQKGIDQTNGGSFTEALDSFLTVYDADTEGEEGIKALAYIAKIFEILRDIPDALKYAKMAEESFANAGIPLTHEFRSRNYCLIARIYIMMHQSGTAENMLKGIGSSDKVEEMNGHVLFLHTALELNYGRMQEADKYIFEYIRRLPDLMKDLTKVQDANEYLMFLATNGRLEDAITVANIMQPFIDQIESASYRMMFYQAKLVLDDITGDQEEKQKDINTYFGIVQQHMAATIGTQLENVKFNLNARLMEKRQDEIEKENAKLREENAIDPLTGLLNRRSMSVRAAEAVEYGVRNHCKIAMGIFDIDCFKQLNDTYGHQKGDEALIAVSNLIRSLESDKFIGCRYGGDEFCIIYKDADFALVEESAEKLSKSIEALNFPNVNSTAKPIMTISQGICVMQPTEQTKVWEMMYNADHALYEVKKNNRGGVKITTI